MPTDPQSASLVVITPGDPAGIGPEVLVEAWHRTDAHGRARLRVCAPPALLRAVLARVPSLPRTEIEQVRGDDVRPSSPATMLVVAPDGPVEAVAPGVVSAGGGRAAVAALAAAFGMVRAATASGTRAALVTGPLHKSALRAAGHDVPGHTEWLARACGLPDDAASMMLWLPADSGRGGGLGVVHATLHERLSSALARISTDGIAAAGARLAPLLRALLGREPRIAVAALNPHGGEGGLFGDEEERIVAPAVRLLRARGIAASGPFPADTLFLRAAGGEFDGVVALYHDQGHIPVKLLGMHRAVNITLGLPVVRTSVAHGTAFDLVGSGRADPASFVGAIDAAVRLAAAGWHGGAA